MCEVLIPGFFEDLEVYQAEMKDPHELTDGDGYYIKKGRSCSEGNSH